MSVTMICEERDCRIKAGEPALTIRKERPGAFHACYRKDYLERVDGLMDTRNTRIPAPVIFCPLQ